MDAYTREETFLNGIANGTGVPEPYTREEKFLKDISKRVNDLEEVIKVAVISFVLNEGALETVLESGKIKTLIEDKSLIGTIEIDDGVAQINILQATFGDSNSLIVSLYDSTTSAIATKTLAAASDDDVFAEEVESND